FGQPITLTATIRILAPGAATPTGTVTFRDGSTILGTVPVTNNRATLTTTLPSVGGRSITAVYNGDGNVLSSTSLGLTQVVSQATTTTALVSSASTSQIGQAVTFTATVSPVAPGSGTITGTVSFLSGTTALGTVSLASGKATFTTSSLNAGQFTITAVYN